MFERLQRTRERVTLLTRESGPLHVWRQSPMYAMDFPSRPATTIEPHPLLAAALGATPTEALANDGNYSAMARACGKRAAKAPRGER